MNREIKFRGFCEKDSEWRHGYYISDGAVHEINTMLKGCGVYASQIDPDSLGQLTGLLDRSGVEIYEGDIVKIWDRGWNCGGMGDKQINSLVEFKDGCFTNAFTRDAGGIEVIGSIYENPELLNK